MRVSFAAVAVAMSFGLAGSAALAQAAPQGAHPAVQRLAACRVIAEGTARLACFDREVAAFEEAAGKQELVVVDRAQVRKTRRSLFGLALPNIDIFGGGDDQADEFQTLETTVAGATQDPHGKWILTVEDGARWVQIDTRNLPIDPRVGHSIAIRRAAIGSYLANVNKQVAIRVRRIQ